MAAQHLERIGKTTVLFCCFLLLTITVLLTVLLTLLLSYCLTYYYYCYCYCYGYYYYSYSSFYNTIITTHMPTRLNPYVRRTGAVGVAARLEFVASSGHDDLGIIAVGARKQQRCGFCGKTGHKRRTCKNVHIGMRFLKLPSPFLKRWKKLQPSATGFHQELFCLLLLVCPSPFALLPFKFNAFFPLYPRALFPFFRSATHATGKHPAARCDAGSYL